ncbi:FRG domain-containing protein [Photobacterium phosphoreum]|uniref:FRG domain-containing protein n=1 Tax=Photobacterium phosphoreum TaxID=659 RepID=UPI000D154F06|nr:FRG domain-containing protein [Photobacterium phosphoreum]PTB31282.1 FRG domain-containing protein [Photobacterium phosphoreum]
MKIVNIESVSEFVDYIEGLDRKNELWFRGVASEDHKPVPGIIWRDIQSKEGALEHSFLVSFKSYIANEELNAWEIFALMQHHGLPTRLLDWSESALVALYFALTSEPNNDGDRVVWVMNPFELNRRCVGVNSLFCPAAIANNNIVVNGVEFNFDLYLGGNLKPAGIERRLPEKPMAINTTQHLKRVSSQKGCFTVHGYSSLGIDKYFENSEDFQMIKIRIKSKQDRLKMVNTLSSLGIDEEFIYQDLDSLCSKIKRINGIYL